ncbi:ubiquitin carboxyl-terminal hydrolase 47 isoform X2 [Ceratina calcarata]|uniref:Ubiquitin carboxyl-terminal hydrolase 47 n=1 Tax=Ceratina calcarata TaxID=156304 RepID=A0AAJ7NG04_9HYME|nr:ubiquitin carboxyl-terminal hydrolase 47 isoform X2 [Ceratina calcarata]
MFEKHLVDRHGTTMICKADQTYLIPCDVLMMGNLPSRKVPVRISTRVKELYDYIEEQCQMQQDRFNLYLCSTELIDLSKMKDKTLSEVGIHLDLEQESLTETKQTLLVVDSGFIPSEYYFKKKRARYCAGSQPKAFDSQASSRYSYHPLSRGEDGDDDVDLGSPLKSPETNYVGLVNQAMTCYLNSLLQSLYMTPEFRNALYNWEYVEGSEKDEANSIPYQLQKLFLNLQTSTKAAVKTTALTQSFGWDSTEAWQQHDIQELCRVMFDALEQKFKNTEQSDLISRFYEGTMIDYVKCLECGNEKSRADTFLDIPLPVRPFGSSETYSSVEESLKAFVQYEILEGNNQYHCDKCNKKCDAHKGLKFTKFPYLLTIHLKRFDFDLETFHRIKLNNKVTFPDILNLNPFISSASVLNGESPATEHDENVASTKSDDSSITNSATLNGDCSSASDNDLPNSLSNHAATTATTTATTTETGTESAIPIETPVTATTTTRNQDQADDEGIGIGPSTSNYIAHNNCENEKKHDEKIAEMGPYNYELFSIMIHSGGASGGHYYAYIKDFRTQEWLCFNDQSVTQITDDDIQKTYGGGSTRSYLSRATSSTSAYMLMYRQIDPARNALPIEVQDFPKHIKKLLEKMKDSEKRENEKINIDIKDIYGRDYEGMEHGPRERRIEAVHGMEELLEKMKDSDKQRENEKINIDIKDIYGENAVMSVYCQRPNEDKKQDMLIFFASHKTLAEMTKHAYQIFDLEGIVSLDQCRLVAYDPSTDTVVNTYEGKEQEKFSSLWRRRSRYCLLLQISGIVTTVYVVDIGGKRLETILNLRALLPQTVREYSQMVGKHLNLEPDEMKLVLRKEDSETVLLENEDAQLAVTELSTKSKVFACVKYDSECNKSFFESTISAIAERLEAVRTLSLKLADVSKEKLKMFDIPIVEEPSKDKEEQIRSGNDVEMKTIVAAENTSKTDPNDVSNACTTASEQHQLESNASNSIKKPIAVDNNKPVDTVRNASPHESTRDGEEWHTPEQSNSEDGSLSDSDKTLDGDVPEDDQLQLSHLTSNSTRNPLIDMLSQVAFEDWDKSECYFKASPYTNHNTKLLKVVVDKRMTFKDLKTNLEPYVGVPSECFEIWDYDEIRSAKTEWVIHNCVSPNLLDTENYSIGIDFFYNLNLQNRMLVVEVYRSASLLKQQMFSFQFPVDENMTVGQMKREILAEMKNKYDIEIPYHFCRLLENTYMLLLEDHQRIKDFHFDAQFRLQILVQELILRRKQPVVVQESSDEDEPVTNSHLITVQRWFPKRKALGPVQKIALDEMTVEEMVKTLSRMSKIPEKHIEIARERRLFRVVDPVNQFQDLTWISLSSGIAELDAGKKNMFMYKDNRDILPQPQPQQQQEQEQEQQQRVSREEYNGITFNEESASMTREVFSSHFAELPLYSRTASYNYPTRYLPVSSAPSSRYTGRKEKALKIHLDAQ